MDILLASKEAIFKQVVEAVKQNIINNTLKPGDKLPSIRVLANQMSVNPNTVMRAYCILEEENFIYSINKKGYYVSQINIDLENKLEENFKKNIRDLILKDYTVEKIIDLVKEEFDNDKLK